MVCAIPWEAVGSSRVIYFATVTYLLHAKNEK